MYIFEVKEFNKSIQTTQLVKGLSQKKVTAAQIQNGRQPRFLERTWGNLNSIQMCERYWEIIITAKQASGRVLAIVISPE